MSTQQSQFFTVLSFAQGEIPTQIQLLPAGTFSGIDGRGPWVVRDINAVIAESMKNGPLPIDENHSTENFISPFSPAPAVGWIKSLFNKNGEIWATVEWTKRGAELVGDKAYRGISPVFDVLPEDGTIIQICSAALTNTPNLKIQKLFNKQETSMALQSELRKALNLEESADDTAILKAVNARTAQSDEKATLALMASLAQPLGVEVKDDAKVDEVVKALQSKIVKNVETLTALQKSDTTAAREIVNLQTQISELQLANARKTAEVVIDKAIEDGKPIKSLRDHYIVRHMQSAKEVENELQAMPVMFGNQATTITANRSAAAIVSEDADVTEILKAAATFIREQQKKGIEVTHSRAVLFVTGKISQV